MSNKTYSPERSVQIKHVRDHWEVYVNGTFLCSADSYLEAINDYYDQCSEGGVL